MTEAEMDYRDMRKFQTLFIEADHELRYTRALCARAANALEYYCREVSSLSLEHYELIAELRETADK